MTKPLGPYTPIVRAGGWLVTAGQIGQRDGSLVEGGVEAETAQAMENIRSLLEGEGAAMDSIVKTTVFLTDIGDWSKVNPPYLSALGNHRPARSAVAVTALPLGARVEIEAWAFVEPQ